MATLAWYKGNILPQIISYVVIYNTIEVNIINTVSMLSAGTRHVNTTSGRSSCVPKLGMLLLVKRSAGLLKPPTHFPFQEQEYKYIENCVRRRDRSLCVSVGKWLEFAPSKREAPKASDSVGKPVPTQHISTPHSTHMTLQIIMNEVACVVSPQLSVLDHLIKEQAL
jgi:hypothetical protein